MRNTLRAAPTAFKCRLIFTTCLAPGLVSLAEILREPLDSSEIAMKLSTRLVGFRESEVARAIP